MHAHNKCYLIQASPKRQRLCTLSIGGQARLLWVCSMCWWPTIVSWAQCETFGFVSCPPIIQEFFIRVWFSLITKQKHESRHTQLQPPCPPAPLPISGTIKNRPHKHPTICDLNFIY
jgi:hypothetical protein